MHSIAAVSSLSPAAPTREMSTDTAGAARSIGVVVGPSNTPASEPVHSRSRVKTRSATRSLVLAGRAVRAAERRMSGPCSMTARTSGTVGSRVPGEPVVEQVDRAAEDDFLGVGDRGFAHEGGQRHQQGQAAGADLPAQLAASGPAIRRSAAPSGPVSSGLIVSRPRPIRITCPPRCSTSAV